MIVKKIKIVYPYTKIKYENNTLVQNIIVDKYIYSGLIFREAFKKTSIGKIYQTHIIYE